MINSKALYVNCWKVIATFFDFNSAVASRTCSKSLKQTVDGTMADILSRWLKKDQGRSFLKLQIMMKFSISCKREDWVAKICAVFKTYSYQGSCVATFNTRANGNKHENHDENTVSPLLHLAALIGHLPTVEILLQQDFVEVHKPYQQWGYVQKEVGTRFRHVNYGSPLYIACRKGHFDVVKTLLEKNASLEIQSKDNKLIEKSPLHVAIRKKRTSIVKLLLEHKADVDVYENISGPTAAEIDKNCSLIECKCCVIM